MMKKMIALGIIVTTVVACVFIKDIDVNEQGMMINFVDNTGYWLEF